MTHDRDIGRLLDAWLAEGPLQVPDHVFDAAVASLRREPPRRAWRLRWRNHEMTLSTRLATAAIVLAAAAGIAIIGYGSLMSPNNPPPEPTPSPSPTAAAQATPTTAPDGCLVDGTPKEPCLGRLEPGSHSLRSPLVPFSVSVPAGWVNPMNILGGAMFERDADFEGAAIYVWPDPVIASQSACTSSPEPGRGRTVRALADFLGSHPGLDVSDRQPVSLGGLSGETMRLAFADGPAVAPCTTRASLFVHADTITDGLWWDLGPGQVMKVWLLEAGDGHTVIVNVQAATADFEAFLEAAQPIVESMQFTRLATCVDSSQCLGELAAGMYTSRVLQVPLSFAVPDGWKNDWDVPLGYALLPVDAAAASEPGIFVFLDVYASNQAACTRTPASGVGRTATDLVAWLGSLPDLSITPPEAVSVGGLQGARVDVSVGSGGPVCVPEYSLWVSDYPPLWWGVTPGHPQRHYLLDLPGRHNVLIAVPAPEAGFDAFVARAEDVIGTFDFAR